MTQAFSALFALVALACALIAIASSRKCAARHSEAIALARALAGMRSKVEAHDSEIERLGDDFRTLRGKFYAERRKHSEPEPVESAPPSVADLKANLRKRVGLVPGRI